MVPYQIAETRQDELFHKLLLIDDAYQAETGYYLSFLERAGYNLLSGYKPYAEYLKQGYLKAGKRHDYSPAAYNKRIQAVRARIRFVFRHSDDYRDAYKRLQLEDVLKEVSTFKKATNQVADEKVLSWTEVQKLVAECDDSTIRLMVTFMAQTAVRISEMLSIRLTGLKKNGSHCSISVIGKGKKQRVVHVDVKLVDEIKDHFAGTEYLFEHNGRQYNRISVTNRIKYQSLKFLGKEISAHVLRHTWATEQLRKNRSLKAVSEYLGHSSSSITADIYQHDRLNPAQAALALSSHTDTDD
jgi:integrase/recombinase XerD